MDSFFLGTILTNSIRRLRSSGALKIKLWRWRKKILFSIFSITFSRILCVIAYRIEHFLRKFAMPVESIHFKIGIVKTIHTNTDLQNLATSHYFIVNTFQLNNTIFTRISPKNLILICKLRYFIPISNFGFRKCFYFILFVFICVNCQREYL